VQHVTGLRITSLCADLQTLHKRRKRPKGSAEPFAGKMLEPKDYDEVTVTTEDFEALRMGDRTRFPTGQPSFSGRQEPAFRRDI
jgi:hypothetical protein